ncbi:MAG: hypothetical protein SRB2_03193 [Desulfobacteraceae bacterium Eth-SRB2]|nr:MAG: hypothetical protein SRB2_03193 [Desulfobacteraceae bacterium Eth-SRB2]
MSVIFNALKSLEFKSAAEKKESKKLIKGRDICSLRRMLFSPRVVLMLDIFIFLVGLGAFHGVHKLKGCIEENSRKSNISGSVKPKFQAYNINKESRGPVKEVTSSREYRIEPKEEPESVDMTPSQNMIPDEVPEPDRVYLPPGRLKIAAPKTPSGKKNDAHYLHPRPYNKRIRNSVSNSGATVLSRATVKGNLSSPPAPSFLTKGRSTLDPAAELSEKPLIDVGTKKTEQEIIHQANVERSMKIVRLVEKIQRSMGTVNDSCTQDLFDQLTLLKGEDDSYVLNLKAFCSFGQKDYETTATYLKRLLEQNEVDFDAGINMAIVEINTNQLQAARKRLAKLRKIYPDNILIPEMIQKLK